MKFTCDIKQLQQSLSVVSRALPSRPSHPVLANILLEADAIAQTVTLTAFDLGVGISKAIEASVEVSGRITAPKAIADVVQRQGSGIAQCEVEETKIRLTFPSGECVLNGIVADEFPALPEVQGQKFVLPADQLAEGLKYSVYSASADEARQVLTAVRCGFYETRMEFAATDGHRLARVVTQVDEVIHDAVWFNLPFKSAIELLKLAQAEDFVSVQADLGQARFIGDRWMLSSRLLEGQYPNYNQLIPRQFQHKISFDRKEMLTALERVTAIPGKLNIVILSFSEGVCQLKVDEADSGIAVESIKVAGENTFKIACNYKYLIDALKTLETSTVSFNVNTATSPFILEPIEAIAEITMLIMPIQVRGEI